MKMETTKTKLNWKMPVEQKILILQIAYRAQNELSVDHADTALNLVKVHCNYCELKLAALLNACKEHFEHDIKGINTHINWKTGELEGQFFPIFTTHWLDTSLSFHVF